MEVDQFSPPGPEERDAADRRGWIFPALLAVALLAAAAALVLFKTSGEETFTATAGATAPSERPVGATAALGIDFGNGARRDFDVLAWKDGMTVADLMDEARKFSPGIRYVARGAGSGAFLRSLEGVENEGVDGRNWLYSLDGRPGTESFGVAKVERGTRVLWEFRRGEE